jgi:hypothetical protein
MLDRIGSLRRRLRNFGGVARAREAACDVGHALRSIRRNPAFTGVAVLTLALGIGANTAVFTLIDQLLLRPLPVREPDTLVLVSAGHLPRFGHVGSVGWKPNDLWGLLVPGNSFAVLGIKGAAGCERRARLG